MLFTVITVCFNEEKNIAYTIDSVLSQSCTDFEYIICDGKSTDKTMEIVEEYRDKFAQKGINFRVCSEKDGGVYFGMNNGIDRAEGEYIVFINGGDRFCNTDVLQKVADVIKSTEEKIDVLYGDVNYIEGNNNFKLVANHEKLIKEMSIAHPCSYSSAKYMKKFKFDTKYKIAADYDFMLKVYLNGGKFLHINDILADFNAGGISNQILEKSAYERLLIRSLYGFSDARITYFKNVLKIKAVKYLKKVKNKVLDVKHCINRFIVQVFRIVTVIIPKKKNLWLFGAWGGGLYSDNTKCLFEYVNSKDINIECIWVSRNESVIEQVRKMGYKAINPFSVRGLWSVARAKFAFCTEHKNDVSMLLNSKTKIINLWHGMGIKAVGAESGWVKDKNEKELKKYAKMCVANYGTWHWMCASDEAKKKYMRSFLVPEKMFHITGQPKDDAFVNVKQCDFIDEIRQNNPDCKIAVYLPTHRNFGKTDKCEETSIETLKIVNEKMARENIVMIFKPHYHEFSKYQEYTDNFSNIIFATDKEKFGDIYTFLPVCDILITDYSGIMFGFLASGKPIIYFTYDFDEYVNNDASFCYDFDEITYGPVCKTWDEVIENLKTIKPENYKERREKLRQRFCPYHDGNNCERVYNQVKNM